MCPATCPGQKPAGSKAAWDLPRIQAGSRFLAERVGPIELPAELGKSEVIGWAATSLFFKEFRIHRAVDTEKNVLV